ncbi:DUF1758 domain-containing protein [Trichonephila clavipes]|nr:DUF1758 domain-containing protein [Trichonephila clavipes]
MYKLISILKIQAVVIDSITSARIRIPLKFIRNITLERGSELADNSTSERIDVLMGSDYISEILGDRNIRISKRLIAVDSIFGYLIQGKEDEVNCKDIFANNLIVENEEFDFDRVRNLWSLETIGINPDNEVPWSDKEILKSFEQNTVYRNKRYETRFLWKEDSRELKSNYEIAKRRSLGLSKTFEKNEELYLKYDEIIKEHLRDGIIERVNMNLDKNINTGCFLHAVVRNKRIVQRYSGRFLRNRNRRGRWASFKIFMDKERGPNLDLSTHNVETFRYPRVTFGVQYSYLPLS